MTNFTPELLISYIYKETTTAENQLIEEALQSDWTLQEKFKVLKTCIEKLDKIPLQSPRQEVIDRIMAAAVATTPVA